MAYIICFSFRRAFVIVERMLCRPISCINSFTIFKLIIYPCDFSVWWIL